jgi:hypothetical protein
MEQNKKASEVLDSYLLDMGDLSDAQYHYMKLAMEEYSKILQAKCERYEKALNIVQKWQTPSTGQFWDDEKTRPMSYESCYGSNGVRDFMRNVAKEALLAGEGEKAENAKEGVVRLILSNLAEVSKDAESAKEYLRNEGVDMTKLEDDAKFVKWLAELSKYLHEASSGQPVKINQVEARKWYDDGMTAYQCFRETWNME